MFYLTVTYNSVVFVSIDSYGMVFIDSYEIFSCLPVLLYVSREASIFFYKKTKISQHRCDSLIKFDAYFGWVSLPNSYGMR